MNGRVCVYTLGCKLNFSESSTISQKFEKEGYVMVDFKNKPDIFVINTCSVTENAEKKCLKIIKDARKISPLAFIIITGCFAQLNPEKVSKKFGVDMVLGMSEKFQLLDKINDFTKREETVIIHTPTPELKDFNSSYSLISDQERTRTFLKIQDGCNYGCTFCTIPLARGKSRSDTIANVLKNAQISIQKGIKEIVLTGVNVGDFINKDGESLYHLLIKLDELPGINRIRISSIEPNLISNDIIELISNSKHIMPHFHVPLQSGSNYILRKMKRRYSIQTYSDRIEMIRKKIPFSCIGADIITGFPGESEKYFLETYRFLNEADINYFHIFPYSEREKTLAMDMKNKISSKQKAERSAMLHNLSERKRRNFYLQNMGKIKNVLIETENRNNRLFGYSEDYIRVAIPYNENYLNKILPVKLEKINEKNIMEGIVL